MTQKKIIVWAMEKMGILFGRAHRVPLGTLIGTSSWCSMEGFYSNMVPEI
jgi:hypothetical protein